jgi:hypothetical protein
MTIFLADFLDCLMVILKKMDYNPLPNSRNDLSTLQFGIGGPVICSQIIDDVIEILLGSQSDELKLGILRGNQSGII